MRHDRARPAQRFNIFRQLTVVGCGRIEHTAWGQLQAESAAHAEPDDAHLSGAPVVGGQMITGGDQVSTAGPWPRSCDLKVLTTHRSF